MLKRINDALPGLVFGIVFYGIVVQLIGVWFVTDKISYSIGLWYGIAIAVGIAAISPQSYMTRPPYMDKRMPIAGS